jgi:hypothetical protein
MDLIVVFVLVVLAIAHAIRNGFDQQRAFESLPTRVDYVQIHPSCITSRGMKCCHCNATSIRNFGKEKVDSVHRLFICNHCGETLYRSDTVAVKTARDKYGTGEKNPWLGE